MINSITIDFDSIFTRIKEKIKYMLILSFIISACVSSFYCFRMKNTNDIVKQKEKERYEENINEHNRDGVIISSKIEALKELIEKQNTYLSESLFMKIDSRKVLKSTIQIVFNNGKFNDDCYYPIGECLRKLKNDKFVNNISDNTNILKKDIEEFVSYNIDYDKSCIEIGIIAQDEETIRKINTNILNYISDNVTNIEAMSKIISIYVNKPIIVFDDDVNIKQTSNLEKLKSLNIELKQSEAEYDNWVSSSIGDYIYSDKAILKKTIVYFCITFILLLVVQIAIEICYIVLSNRINTISYFEDRDIKTICNINKSKYKENIEFYAENICCFLKCNGIKKAAILCDENYAEIIADIINDVDEIEILYSGNILKNADAIKTIENIDNLIVVVNYFNTKKKFFDDIQYRIKSWNKKIVGVIILD